MSIRLSGIVALLVMVLLVSCNFNKKEDCIKLDTKIGTINDSLLKYGAEWGDELEISINTLDFSGLQPIRLQMQEFVDRKINEVQSLKNVGGSEKLLKTELEFLQLEKEIITSRLSVFEQFTDSAAMDNISTAYAAMQLSAIKEAEMLEKLHKLRDEYAEKNKIPKYIERY